MKIFYSLTLVLMLFLTSSIQAQNYWLEFKVNDSTKYYPISEIKKMYFSDVSNSNDRLILHFVDSTQSFPFVDSTRSFPINTISEIQFSEDTSSNIYIITLKFYDSSDTNIDFSTVDRLEIKIDSISSIGEEISFVNIIDNYPNPFQSTTNIDFSLLMDCQLEIVIYDLFGNMIKRIDNSFYSRGKHSVSWDGKAEGGLDVNPGIYYCSLRSSKGAIINKMLKVR